MPRQPRKRQQVTHLRERILIMTLSITKDPTSLAMRAAHGLRGRFGCDVWQRWQNAEEVSQLNFCERQEPRVHPAELSICLRHILNAEGIVQSNLA